MVCVICFGFRAPHIIREFRLEWYVYLAYQRIMGQWAQNPQLRNPNDIILTWHSKSCQTVSGSTMGNTKQRIENVFA